MAPSVPKVWSRDDFEEIFRIAARRRNYESEALLVMADALKLLHFAERNAVLQIAQPRGANGRFAPMPHLTETA